ncbi:MAG: alanine:cation symporter family protein, partial [Planctomycetota bacterium]|nr:alanine:cation symporter family protein [Planctomycetota bacterium]
VQSLGAVKGQVEVLNDHPWIYGIVMAIAVAIVIIGGIRRIATTASKIVPVMCGIYVLAAMWIILANASQVPEAFGRILS